YQVSAPTVSEAFPTIAATLDRLARFRTEVFGALVPGGATAQTRRERNARLAGVARRYGIPFRGIGAE
ncbi:MAG TPA: hypothetical protein VKS03_02515, partial [Thermoanaerobaculia bacterium]|nr:hypothetical protein [Thermoanaerobaculia bacterium]